MKHKRREALMLLLVSAAADHLIRVVHVYPISGFLFTMTILMPAAAAVPASVIRQSFLLISFLFLDGIFLSLSLDPNGYIVYCPCMGRFGNQAEQLLGTLQFGKSINRTIVLPPFIQYVDRDVHFVPFTDYIDIQKLRKFHPVITLQEFTSSVAPRVWQDRYRRIFCFSPRPGPHEHDCNPMDGSPHAPFWRQAVGMDDFAESVFYSPLTPSHHYGNEWILKYKNYPVIAFVGAPSAFPTNSEAVSLQSYIRFSSVALQKGHDYKQRRGIPAGDYIGVHLRHGSDWENACKILREHPASEFFSSKQCWDTSESLPHQLCFQSRSQIVDDIHQIISKSNITVVYIASDADDYDLWKHLYQKLSHQVPDLNLMTPTQTYSSAYPDGYHSGRRAEIIEDLVVLTESTHFLGNCISSFSAFVSRSRRWAGSENAFFAHLMNKDTEQHDEL